MRYEYESIVSESRLHWIYINTQVREQIPFKVSKMQISLQDRSIDLDSLTEIEDDSTFTIEAMPKRSFELNMNVQTDITIEMNLDFVSLSRSRYTALDVLADIGGINSMLISFLGLFFAAWNYGHFDNQMAAQLFRIKEKSGQQISAELFRPAKCCNFVEFFIDLVPIRHREKCCRKSLQMTAIEKARAMMAKEVNIVEIVRSRRLILNLFQKRYACFSH